MTPLTPKAAAIAERNAKIVGLSAPLASGETLSYSQIAEAVGVTRNIVAGVLFRFDHPEYDKAERERRAVAKRKKGKRNA